MEHHKDNTLVQRIAKLVKQNEELSNELKQLREKYETLLVKHDEYEQIVNKYTDYTKVKTVLSTGQEKSLKFNMVTVLYANIHGFSEILPEMNIDLLSDQLDQIFMHFDEIIHEYPIEKIHTIGDSFMCAGGIPNKNITNPIEVVLAAHRMLYFVKDFSVENNSVWEICLAIHTGPVTASQGGKNKIFYDIKGDTVNTVSRLESASINGTLIISVMTYELVKEFFDCEYYCKLPVKYKGFIDTFTVKGIKPELSENGLGIVPNQKFYTSFALIQFHDLQEHILDMLERGLTSDFYYHNIKHTVDVVTEVELIGLAEGVTDEDILLLKTAALFHDCGLTVSYDDHEFHGAQLAREMLPKFNYPTALIDRICELIMATKLPPKPKNLLEAIICDSDLDYLGRTDFIPVSNKLYEELKVRNKIGTLNEWNQAQLNFISKHQYFTKTARKLREVNKQIQIERIRNLIV
ncbi:MAG: adenylate/guanylate cyclase domain-containing protein [Bacteroidota bacterium]|nr:adenylate/guanylate cyclase domain-containing protein [Bacteroidota bacterium]